MKARTFGDPIQPWPDGTGDGTPRNKQERPQEEGHDCKDHAVQVSTDGPLGHGWECGVCGRFLQAG